MSLARKHRFSASRRDSNPGFRHFKARSKVSKPGPLLRLAPTLPLGHWTTLYTHYGYDYKNFSLHSATNGYLYRKRSEELVQEIEKLSKIVLLIPL